MKLLIVESPSKAKTIEKYLGGKYKVVASVGHVRDLPKSNKKAIDIEGGFIPHYEVSPGKEKIISDIKDLVKKADEVLLATDPDREGEAIAWHLKEALDLKKSKFKRVTFHEITPEAIEKAIKEPRDIDENLKRAQEARRVLDRIVGYDLSGLIWKKVRYGLSAGRVQSPALRIVMEREREIRAFKTEKYWIITAKVKTKKGEIFELTCSKEIFDEKEAQRILEVGKKTDWQILKVDESEATRAPRAPFMTSTLQQSSSTRLGFSPGRTMSIAQKLYEAGLITYMRTDSTHLSTVAVAEIKEAVTKNFGAEHFSERVHKNKVKNAQEAHEAIRPTHAINKSAGNGPDFKKLYELIWRRTVSSQMADAKLFKTRISISIEDKIPDFSANGSRLIYPGWLLADPESRGEDVELPKVTEGEKLELVEINSTEKETEPPGRYTEAGLIKELEKRGIGRPSTYASIMSTLEDRGYLIKENKSLRPTDTGEVVSDFIETNFKDYISDTFTADMEDQLDQIADGTREYEKTLSTFYKPFHKDVKSKEKLEKATNLGDADPKFKCPKCGGPLMIKLGRGGKFMSCKKYPDCDGALTIEGVPLEGPKETGEMCPECLASPDRAKRDKPGKLLQRDGRFGKFIACSNYPKCKFIKNDESVKPNSSGVKCPTCNDGEIVERRGRFGAFWSCANYPKCKFAIKAKPTGKVCAMCNSLMMDGTKTIPERCSNNKCPNNRPDKLNKKETK
jgi:DNA topoisomerase-1